MYTFFGFMGIAAALVFCNFGAAYGTARSGVGICTVGTSKPDLVFKSLIPIIMAGILGIYGLIVAVILQGKGKYWSNINFSSQRNTLRQYLRYINMAIQFIQWFQAVCFRSLLRIVFTSRWTLHWSCRRCRCQSKRIEGHLRRSYFDFDFCRSSRTLWPDHLNYSVSHINKLLNTESIKQEKEFITLCIAVNNFSSIIN